MCPQTICALCFVGSVDVFSGYPTFHFSCGLPYGFSLEPLILNNRDTDQNLDKFIDISCILLIIDTEGEFHWMVSHNHQFEVGFFYNFSF